MNRHPVSKNCTTIKAPTYSTFLFGLISGFCIIFLLSCEQKEQDGNKRKEHLASNFNRIDSLYMSLDVRKSLALLDSVRPFLKATDVEELTAFYYFKALSNNSVMTTANKYADSALSLFIDQKTQQKYPNSYTKALLLKSDVLIYYKQYEHALTYYFKIKPLLIHDKTSLHYIKYLTKISDLYFKQRKYRTAASYNLQANELVSNAKNLSLPTAFYLTQSTLNNAGYSYENAFMLDSAKFYYQKGLAYLASPTVKTHIKVDQINIVKIVFLDNLGGLAAKMGNLSESQQLLEKAISLNGDPYSALKKSTYLKLGITYGKLGKLAAADSAFNTVDRILKTEQPYDFQLKLRLQKARSELAALKQQPQQAYSLLKSYVVLSDSLERTTLDLSQLDLELKLENLKDKQQLATLEKTNSNKTAYLVAIALFLLMLAPIILLVLKNMRQAKKAEKATLQHNIQLEKTMKRLELRNKDYAKMMKVMAHDLKNPIGGMVGIANLLLEEDRFLAEDKEMLQLIESSGENSIEMINQLLNSGLAVENEVLKKEKVNLQHLLRQCTELLQYKADEKEQKILFISGGPIEICLSKEKIWRVFNNLIVNAIKFSPAQSTITVKLERLNRCVKVSIIDQGIGVPKGDRDKIFEMFTSAKRPGTAGEQPFGIGLSISKQIVESHDGKIWLDENPDGGTIFYVELPFKTNSNA